MRFTKSRIFLYFCLSFAFGVLAASFFKIPILALYVVAIAAITLISIFWREKKIVIAGFSLIFAIFGIYRYQSVSDNPGLIAKYNNLEEKIVFQGIISEEPDVRIKDAQYVIKIQNAKIKNQNFGVPQGGTTFNLNSDNNFGKVLVTLPHYPEYQYGDLVEFEGKLKAPENFGSFDYKNYLAKDGIYSTMYSPETKLVSSGKGNPVYAAVFKVKNKFKGKIKAMLPEPESSLLAGLLLGERSGLGQELKDDFSITGTSHIVAVSGFNVTIIAVIILELALLLGFSRNQSFWISLATIILFIIMVGAPSSAVRAGIMGALLLVAVRVGRLSSAANAVAFAATLMVVYNPKILRFDTGFELSFLAVAGLIWLYPVLEGYFSASGGSALGGKKTTIFLKIKSMLLVTISAQIMTLPILVYDFGRLSLVAPIANILILPFVPIAMGLGFLAGAAGFIWMGFGKVIGYFAWLVLTYQIRIIEFLASLPWASIEILDFNKTPLIIYYAIIAVILVRANKKRTARMI